MSLINESSLKLVLCYEMSGIFFFFKVQLCVEKKKKHRKNLFVNYFNGMYCKSGYVT